MKKRFIIPIILIISIGFMIFTYFRFPFQDNEINIYSYGNNYVEEYAKENHYSYQTLSLSEYNQLKTSKSLMLESFSYNEVSGGIEITGYEGASENLIIPEYINNIRVVSVHFNKLDSHVKKITIPKTVREMSQDLIENIQIECYQNDFCNNLKETTNLNITFINDSDSINFQNNIDNIVYNVNANGVEITGVGENQEWIIIPKAINGNLVKTISLQLENESKNIFLPESITNITSLTKSENHDVLYLSLMIEVIVFILAVLSIFILGKQKAIYIASLYIIGIIYYFVINFLAYFAPTNLLLYSILVTIIYIVLFLFIYSFQKRLNTYDKQIKDSKTFINEALSLAKKTEDQELIDLILYSDAISTDKTVELEEKIIEKLKSEEKNLNEIKELMEERNDICKKTKK